MLQLLPRTILIVGLDQGVGGIRRADVVLVLTLGTKGARCLHIPRDTSVILPFVGRAKLCEAYAYGGVRLLVRKVEELTKRRVERFVVLTPEGMARLVDLLGGAELTVERRMRYVDKAQGLVIDLKPGRQVLDGRRAVAYARFRGRGGDIGRIRRQQRLLFAILRALKRPRNLLRLPMIVAEAMRSVRTNIGPFEALLLLRRLASVGASGVEFSVLPGRAVKIGGRSYWVARGAR